MQGIYNFCPPPPVKEECKMTKEREELVKTHYVFIIIAIHQVCSGNVSRDIAIKKFSVGSPVPLLGCPMPTPPPVFRAGGDDNKDLLFSSPHQEKLYLLY